MWTPISTILTVTTVTCILLASTALTAYNKGKSVGEQNTQILWEAEKLIETQAKDDVLATAKQKQTELEMALIETQKVHKNETDRINAAHRKLVDSLRQRPTAASASPRSMSEATTTELTDGGWCTGARLYQDHAIAFARESARAAALQATLKACIESYNLPSKLDKGVLD